MRIPLSRAALVIIGCTGLLACSQHASQYGSSDSVMTAGARLCIAEGQPGPLNPADPDSAMWSITVSSEGRPCSHIREWGGGFVVAEAPRHGRITQQSPGGGTVVSYWPDRGYVGSDHFVLRHAAGNLALPYMVAVLP